MEMNIIEILCAISRISVKCAKAGCKTTVMTMKINIILVHFEKEGKRKSISNAKKVAMMTTTKLDNTVPRIVSIKESIGVPSDHFVMSEDKISINTAVCWSHNVRMAIFTAKWDIAASDA